MQRLSIKILLTLGAMIWFTNVGQTQQGTTPTERAEAKVEQLSEKIQRSNPSLELNTEQHIKIRSLYLKQGEELRRIRNGGGSLSDKDDARAALRRRIRQAVMSVLTEQQRLALRR